MQGLYLMIINDNKVTVMGRKQLLGELTVMLMNTPQEIVDELLDLQFALERSPLIHMCKYPYISCDPPITTIFAPNRWATADDLKQTDDLLRSILEILNNTEIGSVLFGHFSMPQIDNVLLDKARYLSDEYMSSLASYQSYFNMIYMAIYDIVVMHECFYELELMVSPMYNSLSASDFCEQYQDFMFPDDEEWSTERLALPLEGEFQLGEPMITQYIPVSKEDGKWYFAEFLRMDTLQGLIKTDFVKGVMKGHLPHRCEHCGRYFLMTKGYHTRFCDMPSPENPKRTCKQMAYAKRREKEKPSEDPKVQSYKRCLDRLNKSCNRGSITPEQKQRLVSLVEELYLKATTTPAFTNEEFEKALQSKQLYAQLGITSRSRGRPQKQQTEQTQQTTSKQK